jgi:hypothetical protein
MEGVSTPEEESVQIYNRVLRDLSSPNRDLRLILRSCSHACMLLNWGEHLQWFQRELQGYPVTVDLPWYRKDVPGALEWKTDAVEAALKSVVAARPFPPPAPITMDVRVGVAWIQSWVGTGLVERTGQKQSYRAFDGRQYEIFEQRSFPSGSFLSVSTHIEEATFQFVSNAYAALRYGGSISDVWNLYRRVVDEKLPTLGLSDHLLTIERGLRSGNPQDWRAVFWGCRDVLHDLAALLWRDPRPTYTHLLGKGKTGKLSVTESDHVNRLGAYLHEKGVIGVRGRYLRSEMERIYSSIQALNEIASTAHTGATLEDARTVAVGTYLVLGELIQRTDMLPVIQYSDQPPGGGSINQDSS